ncbi:MAG: hypothetical protein AAB663_00800 [Patescibacteria group bacterium]
MDRIGRKACARYGMLLDAIVDGTLTLDENGKVTAPAELAKQVARFPETLTSPEARALLAAYVVDGMMTTTTVSQLQRLLAGVGGHGSSTTSFVVLPVVRVCRERREAFADAEKGGKEDKESKDFVVNAYRMLRPDGGVVISAEEGWQPSGAALDLVAIYHLHWYMKVGLDDDEAITRFVYRSVDLLNTMVLWDYFDASLEHYVGTGEGNVTRYLDPFAQRNFGRKLDARNAFDLYLSHNEKGRANLVARGLVDS